ncbi:MAG TPA: DUF1244 domain-containing protein [Alphaproteobacteria bacterium]|nr:alkaline phosphatase [Paracoccaceae bacterium]RCL80336.1 MAG: DUF1244 domain-containing protein [SAR116 cluster bacterium]HBQ23446.1 DUF1244 domain-containing protein [Alphaproteobacteria bacterium]HCJ61633.1 DUF1244 domain-containing protein [Alphaproteobacteria bacterium]HCY47476.1 DUF1244 domain-containing protein [Alphaproteobacteria bacterium]|tara:strand:- start:551 stop:796 length:246 start_codon:yes stop_codon:yes gene_type:complete
MTNDLDVQAKAAAFDRMVKHFRERSDVQNIDVMELAGFCRNCLSRWYQEEENRLGGQMDKEEARRRVYGMDYEEWKSHHQN